MNQKGFVNIILIVVIVAIIAIGGYFIFLKKQDVTPPYSVSADNIVTTNIDGYFETCMNNVTIYKRLNKNWVKALNELPAAGLYYLDNKFFGYGMCDVVSCIELPKPYTIDLIEYQKVSEKTPPPNSGSAANVLPMYQAFPLRGDVKIDIRYYTDNGCRNEKTISTVIKR